MGEQVANLRSQAIEEFLYPYTTLITFSGITLQSAYLLDI